MSTHTLKYYGEEIAGFNFEFAKTHYNIYPWIEEDGALVRVLRLDSAAVVVAHLSQAGRGRAHSLNVTVSSRRNLSRPDLAETRKKLAWSLGLDESYDYLRPLARRDPVLKAALAVNRGIRPKRYPEIFEAVCGAICAQNVDFRRLYRMMESLSVRFGQMAAVSKGAYHSFPTPKAIAQSTIEDLRECKVGYRAAMIKNAAQWFQANQQTLGRLDLRNLPAEEAVSSLCEIPGVGPYSACIVLSACIGRPDIFHLDSFTRHILRTFYFFGREAGDDELRAFVAEKWPGVGGSVAHLLTTNTEVWAARLGHEDMRRSGARHRKTNS